VKTLDPDWMRIRIEVVVQPKMLDPDPYQMNTDPKHNIYVLQTRTLFVSSGAPKGRRQRAAAAAPRGAKTGERGPAATPWLPLTSTRSASGSPR
jgi:hypothetical protein